MTQILSPNKYTGRRAAIRVVVLHTMEVEESGSVAEAVGNAFARASRDASAHVGVDTNSECRYVADADTAWAAPGLNADGLQLEMAGRAGQTTGQWNDPGSRAILERAAQRTATWCRQYSIPVRRLSDAQLAAGLRGIVDHWAASRVYKQSDHTDVGANFPWARFLARVSALVTGLAPAPTPARVLPATRIRLGLDGRFGPRTIARLQQWAGAPVDSFLLKGDWAAIQRKVGGGLKDDGLPGVKTWIAIQRLVGASPDGNPGRLTYLALQTYLNAH